VKAGVGSFMGAYMDLNDVPASANRFLLTDVLRGEWGFEGFVVSDAMAIGNLVVQGHARDGRDAAARALTAGMDMDMASSTYMQNLAGLVKDGMLKMSDINEAVRAHPDGQGAHGSLRASLHRRVEDGKSALRSCPPQGGADRGAKINGAIKE